MKAAGSLLLKQAGFIYHMLAIRTSNHRLTTAGVFKLVSVTLRGVKRSTKYIGMY